MAIEDTSNVAPDNGIDGLKGDVYAFGVLLLELLTGKRPFDRSRPREERSLVKWVSSRLHDNECLEKMVDPNLKKTLSSRALSKFADIVSLCLQQKEFRPPMSEIEESLASLIHKAWGGTNTLISNEGDPFDKSFRSSHSQLLGSPTLTFSSA